MTSTPRIVALLVLCACLDANAQIFAMNSWPFPPCTGTLQACIAMSPGGVEVITNEPIDETIVMSNSTVLVAGAGYQPTFAPNHSIIASSPGGDRSYWIEGFTLPGGLILVQNLHSGSLTATLRNNRCRTINIHADTGGPLFFDVSGNEVRPVHPDPLPIRVLALDAYGEGQIARDDVIMAPTNIAKGISVLVVTGSMEVDVVANRIRGTAYGGGIEIQEDATPTQFFEARVVNNLVTGATAGGAGIQVVRAAFDGFNDAWISNNTVTDGLIGIATSELDAAVGNNVVTGQGIGFDLGSGATVVQHGNLAFDNDFDFIRPPVGPDTLFEDPLYADTTDFRPTPYSPVVNAGDDSMLPPEFTTDLDGNPRRRGTIDIGAYEVPEPASAVAALAELAAVTSLRAARACGASRRRSGRRRPA
jgi:hypothetical protein